MASGVNTIANLAKKVRARSARRAILLATTIVSLGVAALVVAPGLNLSNGYSAALAQNLSEQAHKLQAPVGFADIVEKVKPAVISVRVKVDGGPQTDGFAGNDIPPGLREFFRRFGMPDFPGNPHGLPEGHGHNIITGQGSGFFISADGYAVTNNHVVDKAESVTVTTDDGKMHKAKVIGTDERTDLALIKVDDGPFPYVNLSSNAPRIGDWVLAVGNPFGLGGSVTAGIVSARGRDIGEGPYDDFIQIDAPVNRGNSGGPTFNMAGQVIGVNTAIFTPSGGSVGIAFAVPAETVKAVVAQLKEKGTVVRGYIGVQLQAVTPDIADTLDLKAARGGLVAEAEQDGPAVKAGIEAGDVIAAINDKEVGDSRDVARIISSMAPGTVVKLTIVRGGKEKVVNVTLGTLPSQQANLGPGNPQRPRGINVPQFGLTVAAQPGGEGVVVTDVDPNGVAADRGFKSGDVILEAAGKKIASPNDLLAAVAATEKNGKRAVLLRVKSDDGMRYIALRFERG